MSVPPAALPRAEAPLARRLGALLYELLLLTALLLVASFALAPLVTPGRATGSALVLPDTRGRIVSFVALFVIAGLYFVWCWSGGRRTLAQKTWRLALVAAGGGTPDIRIAVVRYLACCAGPALALLAYVALRPHGAGAYAAWLLAFNWLWALIDRERRFLHDRVAGTRVVLAERREHGSPGDGR